MLVRHVILIYVLLLFIVAKFGGFGVLRFSNTDTECSFEVVNRDALMSSDNGEFRWRIRRPVRDNERELWLANQDRYQICILLDCEIKTKFSFLNDLIFEFCLTCRYVVLCV